MSWGGVPVIAEGAHAKGEDGVRAAKRLLESTTHIRLPFVVYDDPAQTTLTRLDGEHKRFDLAGHFLRDKPHPVSVEVKKYDVRGGGQPEEYTQFLANAYSITACESLQAGGDRRREFIWLTWHPFSQTKWAELTSAGEIKAAVDKYPEVRAGQPFDADMCAAVADRLWLLIMSEKQDQLTLTAHELYRVFTVLDRKGA